MEVDFSSMRPKRKPTRKERGRYKRWVKYLKDSRLSDSEVHNRAAHLAQNRDPPKE